MYHIILPISCYEGVLISLQPNLLPDIVGRNRFCRWNEGSVHVPNYKSLLVTEVERKHVRRRSRFQQQRDVSFFFLQGKAPKEIRSILTETLGEHAPSYAIVKNWVEQSQRVDLSTCDAAHSERLKTVTTPEIINQIHEVFFKDRRISAKSIAEQPGI